MMKKKATKKRILPTAKRGGALPFLPMLGALGSLIGEVASVAKMIDDSKAVSSKSCNVTIARWIADCISFRTNTGADYISVCTNVDRV